MLRDLGSLIDIYNAGNQVLAFAGALTAEEIAEDDMKFSAILFKFIVIGEATKRVSLEFREAHPDIPWKAMAGLRDVIAHQYDNIDVALLNRSISVTLPDLLSKLDAVLPPGA